MRTRNPYRLLLCLIAMSACTNRAGLDPGGFDQPADGGQMAGDVPGAGGQVGKGGGNGGAPGSGGGGGRFLGSGGSSGSGGVTGSGGSLGSAGVTGSGGSPTKDAGRTLDAPAAKDAGRDGILICGPVCDIFCPNGNVLDDRGCPTCKCKPAVECKPLGCAPSCPSGVKKDSNGCDTCVCAEPAMCVRSECGAEPPVAACPSPQQTNVDCVRSDTGKCGWNVSCTKPATCSQYNERNGCDKDTICRWLEPGCGEPKLAAAGCYAAKDVNCMNDKDCGDGRQCLKRVINNCPVGAQCLTCASPVTVCL